MTTTLPTTLAAVSAYLPATSVPIETVGEVLGLTPLDIHVYRKFYGLREVRLDPEANVADLVTAAAKGLNTLTEAAQRVRYVIHARTVHLTGPYSEHPLLEVRRTLGLEHAVSFAVTQHACASGLLAVDVAGRLLAADGDPDALALVLAGEKTYPHITKLMPIPTAMGEAAAACLVGHGGPGDQLLGFAAHTYGDFYTSTGMSREVTANFMKMYPQALADVIQAAATSAGVDLSTVDMILPHNVNRISWVMFARLTGFPVERIFLDNVPVTGHGFCADPFVNYACANERGLLHPGMHYLLVSVGLGATFSAMLLRRGGAS